MNIVCTHLYNLFRLYCNQINKVSQITNAEYNAYLMNDKRSRSSPIHLYVITKYTAIEMVGVSRVSKDNFRVQYIQLTLKNYDRYLLPL